MERLKVIIGFVLLPFAYCLFVVDRMIFVIMPQHEHPKLQDWLTNTTVLFAIIRVFTIVSIRYIVKWIFGI